ncbi:MAG: sulfatase-like hydrolase/transferase [Proteobacteria bacterium]|nr:sulfatase-like hydrolase/transferase [Pseudomonadota bacterium]
MGYREIVFAGIIGAAFAAGVLASREPALRWYYQAGADQPTVVLFVMDTVRADHLSECGYERPTSPTLSVLRESGASVRCDAIAPSSWTVPSHASMFTGLHPADHGTHFVSVGEDVDLSGPVRPLPQDAVTIAERFQDRGYQTVLVSSNRLVSSATGLDQGFDLTWSGGGLSAMDVVEILRRFVRGSLDPERPLFLVLNVMDAHGPYPTVPPGVGWVPERGPAKADEPVLNDIERLVDVYDYGIFLDDTALAAALYVLRGHGWTDQGLRLVVVSDHGEFLGEHGLYSHTTTTYEPVVTVPLVYYEEPGPTPPILGDRPSLLEAHSLLLDGTSEGYRRLSATFAGRGLNDVEGTTDSMWVAEWHDSQKYVWHHGEYSAVDLQADPEEMSPVGVSVTEVGEVLPAYLHQMQESGQASPEDHVDEALIKQLKEMGYIE